MCSCTEHRTTWHPRGTSASGVATAQSGEPGWKGWELSPPSEGQTSRRPRVACPGCCVLRAIRRCSFKQGETWPSFILETSVRGQNERETTGGAVGLECTKRMEKSSIGEGRADGAQGVSNYPWREKKRELLGMTPGFLVGARGMPLTETKMTGMGATWGTMTGSVWRWPLWPYHCIVVLFLRILNCWRGKGPQTSVQATSTFDRPPACSSVSFFLFVFVFQTAFKIALPQFCPRPPPLSLSACSGRRTPSVFLASGEVTPKPMLSAQWSHL